MNYLQLCQRLRQECGITGTGPTTVASQAGEYKRVVDWVSQAWLDIQIEHPEWDWLRRSFQFNTTAGDGAYTYSDASITDFASWRADSFRCWLTSSGSGAELHLTHMQYDRFRDLYLFGSWRTTNGDPTVIAIAPDKSLLIGPTPNAIYTVVGEYFATPQVLELDADIPNIPDRYHMAIIYRAMMLYARFDNAAAEYADADANYRRIMRKIEIDQMQDVEIGAPLV